MGVENGEETDEAGGGEKSKTGQVSPGFPRMQRGSWRPGHM